MNHLCPFRIGQGYDVHRFAPGRELWLCGVKVPHSEGLLGHSDADVAIHALCDALLGAAALRDIGYHFPDTDPAYAGADSRRLLARVVELLAAEGYAVGNVDVTIIAQRPKLAPHIPAMRAELARVMGVSEGAVSVKATTTEGLGFTGRGEGIAAQAIALVQSAECRVQSGHPEVQSAECRVQSGRPEVTSGKSPRNCDGMAGVQSEE